MSPRTDRKPRQANFFSFCHTCQNKCCAGARPPLTLKRRQIILSFLQENKIPIDTPFENGKYAFPRENDDGYCIFLGKITGKCRIHPVKPETCVAGPFTFDIDVETGKIEWFLKMSKICQLAGSLLKDRESYRKHETSAKHEIQCLVRELDAKELRAILAIEEPDTIKVAEGNAGPEVLAKLKS